MRAKLSYAFVGFDLVAFSLCHMADLVYDSMATNITKKIDGGRFKSLKQYRQPCSGLLVYLLNMTCNV